MPEKWQPVKNLLVSCINEQFEDAKTQSQTYPGIYASKINIFDINILIDYCRKGRYHTDGKK